MTDLIDILYYEETGKLLTIDKLKQEWREKCSGITSDMIGDAFIMTRGKLNESKDKESNNKEKMEEERDMRRSYE